MVVIRLSRVGKKSHATWRLIASDKRKDTLGTYLELLGSYDPHQSPAAIQLNADRIKYWLSVGAKPSPTVHNLLVDQKIISEAKLARKMVKTPASPSADGVPPSAQGGAAEASAEAAPAAAPKAKPAEAPAEEKKAE